MSANSKWLFFSLIVVSNLIFLAAWLFSFFSEVRDKCRAKAPRLYLCLCLCCRTHLIREEERLAKARQRNEEFLLQLDNITSSKSDSPSVMADLRAKLISGQEFTDRPKF